MRGLSEKKRKAKREQIRNHGVVERCVGLAKGVVAMVDEKRDGPQGGISERGRETRGVRKKRRRRERKPVDVDDDGRLGLPSSSL